MCCQATGETRLIILTCWGDGDATEVEGENKDDQEAVFFCQVKLKLISREDARSPAFQVVSNFFCFKNRSQIWYIYRMEKLFFYLFPFCYRESVCMIWKKFVCTLLKIKKFFELIDFFQKETWHVFEMLKKPFLQKGSVFLSPVYYCNFYFCHTFISSFEKK